MDSRDKFVLDSVRNGRRMIVGSPNWDVVIRLESQGLVTVTGRKQETLFTDTAMVKAVSR
jgi:hypothetical protein